MPKKKLFLLISIIIFLLFVFFSYLVSKEKFTQIDFNTTVRLQDHISRRFDLPFTLLSDIGSAEITGLFWIGLLFFLLLKRYFLASASLSMFWIGHIFELFGKTFLLHPAPPRFLFRGFSGLNFPSFYVHTDYSYPSGHMMRTSFLVVFLLLFIYYKSNHMVKLPILLGLIFFVIIMAVSRVYLGEHWTTDVIGGTLLGSSLAVFCAIFLPFKKSSEG